MRPGRCEFPLLSESSRQGDRGQADKESCLPPPPPPPPPAGANPRGISRPYSRNFSEHMEHNVSTPFLQTKGGRARQIARRASAGVPPASYSDRRRIGQRPGATQCTNAGPTAAGRVVRGRIAINMKNTTPSIQYASVLAWPPPSAVSRRTASLIDRRLSTHEQILRRSGP